MPAKSDAGNADGLVASVERVGVITAEHFQVFLQIRIAETVKSPDSEPDLSRSESLTVVPVPRPSAQLLNKRSLLFLKSLNV